jgi:uncharacterized protein YndB with AHSA1/START domain
MSDFEPGPPANIARERTGDRWTLVFVRDLRYPPEHVWAALTEPAQLAAWAPYTADRDLGSVGPATLTMIDGPTGGPGDTPLPTEVLRVEPPTLLEYGWGTDLLRWELAAAGTGTRLTLRHTMADRDAVPMVAAGWHLCLAVADRLLEGHPIDPIRGEDARNYGWEDLRDAYGDRLPDR